MSSPTLKGSRRLPPAPRVATSRGESPGAQIYATYKNDATEKPETPPPGKTNGKSYWPVKMRKTDLGRDVLLGSMSSPSPKKRRGRTTHKQRTNKPTDEQTNEKKTEKRPATSNYQLAPNDDEEQTTNTRQQTPNNKQ